MRRAPTAWKVAPGAVWIQSNDPATAKALSRIRGARRVAYSVAGPFLQTYEMPRPLTWAESWIARQQGTNEPFSDPAGFQAHFVSVGVSAQPAPDAERSQGKIAGQIEGGNNAGS